MAQTMQNLMNGRFGVGFAMAFGRLLPPRVGRRLADALADRLAARRESSLVRAVRANQWVVSGGALSAAELDLAVRDTLRHAARCLYDLYHHLHDPAALQARAAFGADVAPLLAGEHGSLILVGAHLSNFDLVARAAALRGMRAQVLSFPEPGGGYRWQNELRRRAGLDITPASGEAIKRAVRHLRAGGVVVTGADRPVPDGRYQPTFFGRPAAVPLIHVTLAQRTGAPIRVVGLRLGEDGRYHARLSPPIPLQSHADRRTELLLNAEATLRVVETYIQAAPRQWLMFYPVWPEVMATTN